MTGCAADGKLSANYRSTPGNHPPDKPDLDDFFFEACPSELGPSGHAS